MKLICFYLSILFLYACNNEPQKIYLESPDHQIEIETGIRKENNAPFYIIRYRGSTILDTSNLGLILKEFDLAKDIEINSWNSSYTNEVWEPVWGQKSSIKNEYNETTISLKHKHSNFHFYIEFRCFNDGIAFRYMIPEQSLSDSINILNELTTFNIVGHQYAWSIPAFSPLKYELLYKKTGLDSIKQVHTPLTLTTDDSVYISIHEANLNNYASMTLIKNENQLLETDLVPWQDGVKVKSKLPVESPWRTIMITDSPGKLIESDLILNLNPETKYQDLSWIKPAKYMGIWWGIHIGKYSFQTGSRHGATTENAIGYIDFASKHNFDELLIEGWNEGWEGAWYNSYGRSMDFVSPTPDFDIDSVQRYALSKNISVQGYIETCANTERFLDQIDTAFSLFQNLGYKTVKIGHVGPKFYNGEFHHGQYGVNYYRKVLKKAADYKLKVNFHEPIKPTGECRTFPHMMSSEGARGQEYNASWSTITNPPNHTCILPFTRLLAGPMDFTPGIFNLKGYHPKSRVNTTLCKQLALYIVMYSPLQMAADLPENYRNHPCFQFIKDVPVDWETIKVIDAKIGEYVIIVRKDKYSENWYLGGITNEKNRNFKLPLSFLDENRAYKAIIYKDKTSTNWKDEPETYEIIEREVKYNEVLDLYFASGGGQVIQFVAH